MPGSPDTGPRAVRQADTKPGQRRTAQHRARGAPGRGRRPRRPTLSAFGPTYFGRLAITVSGAEITNLVLPLQQAGIIRGRFVHEDVSGTPLARAPMVLAAADSSSSPAGLAASDNEGNIGASAFEIHGIVPGSYRLLVTARPTTVVKSIDVGGRDHTVRPIEVSPAQDIGGVTITLTDNVAAVSGRVRDAQGMPTSNAAVVLFSTDTTLWPGLMLATPWAKSTAPEVDGAFRFPAIAAGEYFWLQSTLVISGTGLIRRFSARWRRSRHVFHCSGARANRSTCVSRR